MTNRSKVIGAININQSEDMVKLSYTNKDKVAEQSQMTPPRSFNYKWLMSYSQKLRNKVLTNQNIGAELSYNN